MLKLNEEYELNRSILKCDFIRYSPIEYSTIKTAISRIYINMPREGCVISLSTIYLDLNFDAVHAATNNRHAAGADIRLVNLGSIALFSNFKLTISSGKQLEDISHAHIVFLMYKLITFARDTYGLSIGFEKYRGKCQLELTNNKIIKRKYHVRIMLKDMFGFPEHQNKATFGRGYGLILTRNSDNAVLNKGNATNFGKIKINSIDWYLPHYAASIEQQSVLMQQIVDKTPTELRYPERSVFKKALFTQTLWSFELGSQEGINVPIWLCTTFQQTDRQHDHFLNNDAFVRLPITSVQCINGTEKYPDVSILSNYGDDDYSQGYSQIEEPFRALTNDNIVQH